MLISFLMQKVLVVRGSCSRVHYGTLEHSKFADFGHHYELEYHEGVINAPPVC